MMTSVYSSFWNAIRHSFDYKAAIANWLTFADEISIAVNTSTDGTWEALDTYVTESGLPVVLTKTDYDLMSDPFAYGKIENTALQRCTGDILIQQNGDERMRVDRDILDMIGLKLIATPAVGALFVPTMDLYGSKHRYVNLGKKWYIHKPGFFRGAVTFGIKADGRPDYNKTSTDELIDRNGNLVPTVDLLPDMTIETLRPYVARGMPLVYHLGYLDFKERIDRSLWWKDFWVRATGGDENKHPTSIEEIAARETKEHQIPLWDEINVP